MASDNTLIIRINGSAKSFLDEIDKVKQKTATLQKALAKTAKVSATAFAGFAGVIALVTKSFADYEKALVGVGKTTNIEGKRLQKFGQEFKKLSSAIPISTNELLGIAQAAGQLGIEGEENLLKFTETIAKLGVATDLTGEQAATSLARLLGLTKESVGSIDKLGSVLVALGNSSKASESEILKMALSVSKATTVFGISSGDAAAFGTVLKELGQEAQLGGSVIGRSFLKIQKAIDDGGPSLERLSELTGIAGDQLKQTFQEDAAGVFRSFLSGVGNLEGGTTALFKELERFGLKGDEINKVLPALAQNTELLNKAFNTTAKELANPTALTKEAAAAFATLSSTAQRVSNNFDNLKASIGAKLAPTITELLDGLNTFLISLTNLDDEIVSSVASFLKWGAIISGLVATVAGFLTGVLSLSAAISVLGAFFLPAAVTASAFWIAVTGPIGLAVAGVAALAVGFVALKSALSDRDPPKTLTGITNELKKINEEIDGLEARKGSLRGSEFVNLRSLKDQREELEKLREAKIRASEDFGTGELLVRPKADNSNFDPLQGIDKAITGPQINAAEQANVEEDKAIAAKTKAEAEARAIKDALDEEQLAKDKEKAAGKAKQEEEDAQKRIDTLKTTNTELKAIKEASDAEETAADKAIAERKQEIENGRIEAKKIKNAEERDLTLQNLELQHEEELASIDEFEATKSERALGRAEEKAALDEALRALTKEQQARFNEEDRASLSSQIDTQKEAEKKASETKIQRQIKERNQFKQDEIKFGTQIATLKQFFASQEVQGVKNATNQLVQLSNSRNSTLKGIGKAAARVQAAIKTAEGAISAYASLSGIPLIGPVLGAAAAGAIIAFGVEQQQKISSAATGGFVPPSGGGSRDRTNMLLEPGELVVPQALTPNFIQSVGNPANGDFANDDSGASSGGSSSTIQLEGDLIQNEEFVSALATELRNQQEFDNVRI